MSQYYQAFGLAVESTYELPELFPLAPEQAGAPADLAIRPATERDKIPPATTFPGHDWHELRRLFQRAENGDRYLLWPEVGRVRVAQGQLIALQPEPDTPEEILRLHILGSAMGIVLHQRGYYPLHASAVAVGDAAIAFVGMWGEGKSTMAAAMHLQGHTLLTDDIAAIDLRSPQPTIAAGFPQMKLWPDSATLFEEDPHTLPLVLPDDEKRKKLLTIVPPKAALPLRAIYLLQDGPSAQIHCLAPKDAFFELLTNWYGARFGDEFLDAAERQLLFAQTLQLTKTVPTFALIRPAILDQLPSLVEMVANHSHSLSHDQ